MPTLKDFLLHQLHTHNSARRTKGYDEKNSQDRKLFASDIKLRKDMEVSLRGPRKPQLFAGEHRDSEGRRVCNRCDHVLRPTSSGRKCGCP